MTEAGAYLGAIEALKTSLQLDRAYDLIPAAMDRLADAAVEERIGALVLAADFSGARDSPAAGLALVGQALAMCSPEQPSSGYVRATEQAGSATSPG